MCFMQSDLESRKQYTQSLLPHYLIPKLSKALGTLFFELFLNKIDTEFEAKKVTVCIEKLAEWRSIDPTVENSCSRHQILIMKN